MKSEITIRNAGHMPILLIICGGPIGKNSNNEIPRDAAVTSITKKQMEGNNEKQKKPSLAVKTK
ncbi:hypothetical protein [Sphingobacterium thalpophilum]|uniref:hypothetical protein n=1 Tax=Sphingobacterium thalpophilum TaxID=259 RepID=UPI003C7687A0